MDHGNVQDGSRFFANKACEYYPCHNCEEALNCLFCYCPLYLLPSCPGTPSFPVLKGKRIKDCSNCCFPHKAENYDEVVETLAAHVF